MERLAYVTIDDSPTTSTLRLLNLLNNRGIRALFFCRGDRIELLHDVSVAILEAGHHIGNHSFSHIPSSTMHLEEWTEDLERTERLIDGVYGHCGIQRPGRYFRFPYLDRGDGDRLERRLDTSLNEWKKIHNPCKKAKEFQRVLLKRGFVSPFLDVCHPLFLAADRSMARDSLVSFSSFDWMLTRRHCSVSETSLGDLKDRLARDAWLWGGRGRHVLLFHDDPDDLTKATASILDALCDGGFGFVDPN